MACKLFSRRMLYRRGEQSVNFLTADSDDCFLRLTNGCSVRLLGDLVQSLGKGQDREFRVQSAEVIGQCNPDVWYQRFYRAVS